MLVQKNGLLKKWSSLFDLYSPYNTFNHEYRDIFSNLVFFKWKQKKKIYKLLTDMLVTVTTVLAVSWFSTTKGILYRLGILIRNNTFFTILHWNEPETSGRFVTIQRGFTQKNSQLHKWKTTLNLYDANNIHILEQSQIWIPVFE